ncbi:MAG: hypothetical protein C0196_03515 [Dictyoglomus turgidum]|nr:MAG: hypothetical protein C0196_03515 [Dictyoglomus turgidum]
MKILYLTSMYPYDKNESSGIFVIKRIEILQKNDIDLKVLALVLKHNYFVRKLLKLSDIAIERTSKKYNYIDFIISIPSLGTYFGSKGKYYQRIAELFLEKISSKYHLGDFDLIHAHFVQGAGHTAYLLNKLFNIPYIVTAHGSDIHTNPLKDNYTKKITIEILNNSCLNIFVSNYLLNAAKTLGYTSCNYKVLYNGYSKEDFYIIEKSLARKNLFRYKKGNYIVGYVGNLLKIKGVHLLPYIFKEISKNLNNVQFLIVGDGPLMGYLKKMCEKFSLDVIFTGIISHKDLKYMYNSMDVLVLPSFKEGLSCVAIEAQACGIPVIGSNAGGLPEILSFNKKYNRIIPLEEDHRKFIKNFAQCVLEILGSSVNPEEISQNIAHLEWEKIVKEEISIYKNLTGGFVNK